MNKGFRKEVNERLKVGLGDQEGKTSYIRLS